MHLMFGRIVTPEKEAHISEPTQGKAQDILEGMEKGHHPIFLEKHRRLFCTRGIIPSQISQL